MKSYEQDHSAFTLLELILSVILIIIIFSISIPNIVKRYERFKAESIVEDILSLWSFIQAQSLYIRSTVCLEIMEDKYLVRILEHKKWKSFLNRTHIIPNGIELNSSVKFICFNPSGQCSYASIYVKSKHYSYHIVIDPDDCEAYVFK